LCGCFCCVSGVCFSDSGFFFFFFLTSTENQIQESFYPYVQHEISVLIELPLGHLCCLLTVVQPQPNSPAYNVFNFNLENRRVFFFFFFKIKRKILEIFYQIDEILPKFQIDNLHMNNRF